MRVSIIHHLGDQLARRCRQAEAEHVVARREIPVRQSRYACAIGTKTDPEAAWCG